MEFGQVISGAQLRAGRGMLGLSSKQCASLANVSWATIKRFELTDGIPPSRGGTLTRVAAALESAGIEFIGDPVKSPGVRLRRGAPSA